MSEPAKSSFDREPWEREDGTLDAVKMTRILRARVAKELASRKGEARYRWLQEQAAKVIPAFRDVSKTH